MAQRKARYFEDLKVGDTFSYTRRIGAKDVRGFAEISGDDNPLHLDERFARTTRFGGRIVHGMLTASLISSLVGVKLGVPGVIYLGQTLNFRAPVRPGDSVTARAVVKRREAKRSRVTFETVCSVGDRVVIDGEALVIVPPRPA
ncbi:MAG TPA: MaoC family dehydratase [Alphaproteobacteria bacterium]|nr:MaoC family dehydratase [Alphaproteobacteria bacterium]